MHLPLPLVLLLVTIVLLATPRLRYKKRAKCNCGCQCGKADQKSQSLTQPEAGKTAPSASAPADSGEASDKLSQDENLQLKQALFLAESVKALEGQFAGIKSRLPDLDKSEKGSAQAQARSRELATITEQLRIARSYSNELMRFVMARYQSQTDGQHIPSFSDASWALIAGNLGLSFARRRIVALN